MPSPREEDFTHHAGSRVEIRDIESGPCTSKRLGCLVVLSVSWKGPEACSRGSDQALDLVLVEEEGCWLRVFVQEAKCDPGSLDLGHERLSLFSAVVSIAHGDNLRSFITDL